MILSYTEKNVRRLDLCKISYWQTGFHEILFKMSSIVISYIATALWADISHLTSLHRNGSHRPHVDLCPVLLGVNALKQIPNGRPFADDNFKLMFVCVKRCVFIQFHCGLLQMIPFTMRNIWFRKCNGAKQATSHYMNPWWLNLLMYVYMRRAASFR